MAMAASAAAATFLAPVRRFFTRLTSLLIVRATVKASAAHAFDSHARANLRRLPMGTRIYAALSAYIRPAKRWGQCAYESTAAEGSIVTYFHKCVPIFVHAKASKERAGVSNQPNDSGMFADLEISFLRGTFNLEQFLIDAITKANAIEPLTQTRFRVTRLTGMRGRANTGFGGTIDKSDDSILRKGSNDWLRFIGYVADDLGTPDTKEPFQSLAYPADVMKLVDEIRFWHKSREWYELRQIPWRFGVHLYGPPGTGKSSLVRAVAQELFLPVHAYDLSTMTNQDLQNYWKSSMSDAPLVILLEDLDRLFEAKPDTSSDIMSQPGVTVDALLNCISGVDVADGVLLFVTSNDSSKLPDALMRPGRLDRHIELGCLSDEQRTAIATRIMDGCPHLIHGTVFAGMGETGAEFTERCTTLALREYWKGKSV